MQPAHVFLPAAAVFTCLPRQGRPVYLYAGLPLYGRHCGVNCPGRLFPHPLDPDPARICLAYPFSLDQPVYLAGRPGGFKPPGLPSHPPPLCCLLRHSHGHQLSGAGARAGRYVLYLALLPQYPIALSRAGASIGHPSGKHPLSGSHLPWWVPCPSIISLGGKADPPLSRQAAAPAYCPHPPFFFILCRTTR